MISDIIGCWYFVVVAVVVDKINLFSSGIWAVMRWPGSCTPCSPVGNISVWCTWNPLFPMVFHSKFIVHNYHLFGFSCFASKARFLQSVNKSINCIILFCHQICCSRTYPLPSSREGFLVWGPRSSGNFTVFSYFSLTILVFKISYPSEFSMTFHRVGMDIFWDLHNDTFGRADDPDPWQLALVACQ